MFNVVASGQINVVKDGKTEQSFDIAARFANSLGKTIKICENFVVNATSGDITLNLGQISEMAGFILMISGGQVMVKHDSNAAPLKVSSFLFGDITVSDVKISTLSTTDVTVEYYAYQ